MTRSYDLHAPPRVEVTTHSGFAFTLDASVFALSSSRTLENPSATCVIELRGHTLDNTGDSRIDGKRYDDVLGLFDLVKIWRHGRDGREWLDGIYLLDEATETRLPSDEGLTLGVTLSLLSVGEAFVRYRLFWHPWLVERANIGGLGFLLRAKGLLPKGRPREIVQGIYDAFCNDAYLFTYADGKKLRERVALSFVDSTDSLSQNAFSILSGDSSLWETMKRYTDAPWNEFFLDVPHERARSYGGGVDAATMQLAGVGLPYGEQEALYLRPTPFDFDRWDALYQEDGWGFDFDGSDLMGGGFTSVASAGSHANFFWTSAQVTLGGFNQAQVIRERSGNRLPRYDEGSITRFGLRMQQNDTAFVHINKAADAQAPLTPEQKQRGNTQASEFWQMLEKRTKQSHLWFGYPLYRTATLVTAGRIGAGREDGGRIGGVLYDRVGDRQYYITALSQRWTFGSPWTTSFTLSRGHRPKALRKWWAARENTPIAQAPEPPTLNG